MAVLLILPACKRAAPPPPPVTERSPGGKQEISPRPPNRPATAVAAPSLPEFEVKAVSTREGEASWYDVPEASLARRRAWPDEMTAASDSLPLNTYVRVYRRGSNQSVVLRITDHGIHQKGTIIDVDRAAAKALGMVKAGKIHVKLEVLALRNADAVGPSPGTASAQTSPAKQPGASAAQEEAAAASKPGGDIQR